MQGSRSRVLAFATMAAAGLACAGCSGSGNNGGAADASTTGSGSDGGSGGSIDAAAPDGSSASAITMTGQLVDLISRMPVAGVAVSVVDHPEITPVMTDASGNYSLPGVSAGAVVVLQFAKDGYVPAVTRILHTANSDYNVANGTALFLVSRSAENLLASTVGVTLSPDKGLVVLNLYNGDTGAALAGAQVAIDPQTGSDPYYFNASGIPDPNLTATSSNGSVAFVNEGPGMATVTATAPSLPNCVVVGPEASYPAEVQTFADTVTLLGTIACSQ